MYKRKANNQIKQIEFMLVSITKNGKSSVLRSKKDTDNDLREIRKILSEQQNDGI